MARRSVDVDPASVTVRTFEAGRAYYLGDYFGKAGIETAGGGAAPASATDAADRGWAVG